MSEPRRSEAVAVRSPVKKFLSGSASGVTSGKRRERPVCRSLRSRLTFCTPVPGFIFVKLQHFFYNRLTLLKQNSKVILLRSGWGLVACKCAATAPLVVARTCYASSPDSCCANGDRISMW